MAKAKPKTKQPAKAPLTKPDPPVGSRTLMDIHHNLMERYKLNQRAFQDTFGVPLKSFWDHMTGFDVIRFDDFVEPEDDQSTEEVVLARYGQKAVDLCRRLLGRRPQGTP